MGLLSIDLSYKPDLVQRIVQHLLYRTRTPIEVKDAKQPLERYLSCTQFLIKYVTMRLLCIIYIFFRNMLKVCHPVACNPDMDLRGKSMLAGHISSLQQN